MHPNNNLKDLLSSTLKVVGDTLNSNLCAIYEEKNPMDFCCISGYKLPSSSHADNLIQIIRRQAENSIQYQQITFLRIKADKVVYIVPITIGETFGVLALGFDCELDSYGVEILETIKDILSSAMERFYLQQQLNKQYFNTIKSLVMAIEAKDVYTQGHSQRVAGFCKIIGKQMKLKEEAIKELEITGLVHDIGKIGINDQLLNKPDKLTEDEFELMRQHPEIGCRILKPLNVSENVMIGTLLHHKRYDLKGYPENAKIDKLPLVPAIIGVADAFDAMTSERSYKKIYTKQKAVAELKRFSGTQFHPDIVNIMEELVAYNKI